MSLRVSFLVDGFNVYHSVKDAQGVTGVCCKWLNISALCASHLQLFGKDAALEEVYYFSALAKHLATKKPDVVSRHQVLIRALQSTGIRVEMGHFKRKTVWCDTCQKKIERYEEKETDVAICVRLVELVVADRCDIAVVLSGDTDIAPGIRTAKRLAPHKRVCVITPFGRKNAELQQIADQCFGIRAATYAKYLFPDPVVLPDGREIHKPATW